MCIRDRIKETLEEIARLDAVLIVHAEDSEILAQAPQIGGQKYQDYLNSRPRSAENTAIHNLLELAKETRCV